MSLYVVEVNIREADGKAYSRALKLETRKEIENLDLANELLLEIHRTIESMDMVLEVDETLNPGVTE